MQCTSPIYMVLHSKLQGGHSSGKPGKVRELKSGQGKWKKSEKSGKMNYHNYSVAANIVETEICNNGVPM